MCFERGIKRLFSFIFPESHYCGCKSVALNNGFVSCALPGIIYGLHRTMQEFGYFDAVVHAETHEGINP